MSTLQASQLSLLAGASLAAGAVNAVAGGGSLISFPALLAVGYPALTANVTNTVALVMYTLSAAGFSRTELAGQAGRLRRLALATAIGGAAGAALLLSTPARVFEQLVPLLIGGASLVLLLQPAITRRTGGVVGPTT